MIETTQTNETLLADNYEKLPLPTGLNVLTILTIIWCVLSLGLSVFGFFSAKGSYEKKDQSIEMMKSTETPKFVRSMMGDPENFEKMIVKSYENRLPILILGIVSVALCFVGALQMRKRKKQGYLLYVIGELLPFVSLAFFVGFFALSGFGFIISAVIAALFIFLYTLQKKHLLY
ncbi:MAG: hypothetical protein ACKVOM_05690 [Ferruginibacter sp.]